MTIIEFLNARLSEDEQAARAADQKSSSPWLREYEELAGTDRRWLDVTAADGATKVVDTESGAIGPVLEVAEHMALHDPARVLREVAAKRAILLQYTDAVTDWEEDREAPDAVGALEVVIRHMAAVYADHTDYDPEWSA